MTARTFSIKCTGKQWQNGIYIEAELSRLSKKILKEFAQQLNQDLNKKFNKSFEINNKVIDEAHVTLIYSKKPFQGTVVIPRSYLKFNTKIIGFKKFDSDKDKIYALTLKLDCKKCKELHEYLMKKYNFKYDYDQYIPHITISYNTKDITQKMLDQIVDQYKKENKFIWLGFDKINIEPLNENWADDKK